MPKISIDGVVREMTAEEAAALEADRQKIPAPDLTAEERLSALESAMLAVMGGGCDV